MTDDVTSHLYHGPNGLESDPLRNFKFLVKFSRKDASGTVVGLKLGFTSVEGFSLTTESIPYRQGGYNTTVQQIPGQTHFSPITLQRGVLLGTRQNWDWMKELFSVQAGKGSGRKAGEAKGFRSEMTVYVLEHPVTVGTHLNSPIKITVHNVWPTSVSYSPLNAGDNGFLVEQLTVVHEGFEVDWAKGLKDSA